jgi:hypothetical protein
MLGMVADGEFQRRSRTQRIAKYIEGARDSGAHGGMALLEGLQSDFKGRNDGIT